MTIHCIVYNDQTCRAGRCRETPKSGEGFPFVIGHDFGNEYLLLNIYWIFWRCEKSHFPLRGVRKPLVRPKVAHCYLSKSVFTVHCSVSFQTSIKAQPCLQAEGCGWPLVLNGHKGKDEGWMGLKTVPSPCIEEMGGPWSAGEIQITKKISARSCFLFPTCQAALGKQEWGREAIVGKSLNHPSFPRT